MRVTTLNENGHEFEREKKRRGIREDLEGDKGKEKWCDYIKT